MTWETALYAVGAAIAAGGAVSASNAASTAQKSSAAAEDYNAQVAAQNAEIAHRNAASREDAQRRDANAKLAHQRAAIAQSGFDPASGTLGLVQEQSADNAELDALMIRYGGNLEARGLNSGSILDSYRANALRTSAAATRSGGYTSAAAGLLTSAANYNRAGFKGG